jgi:hypothetical protein
MITQSLVDTVAGYLKGKRREKLLASIEILQTSLAQDAWVQRGGAKAASGFYQGLVQRASSSEFELYMCLRFGQQYEGDPTRAEIQQVTDVPVEVVLAWVHLVQEVHAARDALDAARPKPTTTPVGLSPRVTKTLLECNLDLELSSIKMAEIKYYTRPLLDAQGKPKLNARGKPVLEKVYYVVWSKGILHGRSRFGDNGRLGCEACGKHIPSGRFVPVEARCKNLGLVSLWLGCDCAKNIFGVKDVGVDRNVKGP